LPKICLQSFKASGHPRLALSREMVASHELYFA
jgi:hypothetical protein